MSRPAPGPASARPHFSCADVVEAAGLRLGRRSGKEQRFQCPFPDHSDEDPSASYNLDRDGWYCHVCKKGGTAWDLVAAVGGVDPGDKRAVYELSVKYGLLANNGAPPRRKSVRTYPYVDESGTLLYEVVRYEPKDFRQRRRDGQGGWIWKLDGVRRVPYRLPELLAAADDVEIHVTEGEKDTENLKALGFIVTTNAQGADSWLAEFSNYFKPNQRVVIHEHNDSNGRRRTEKIGRFLLGHVASIKVLRLPGLAEHGDVSDWLEGKDRDAAAEGLSRRIDEAAEWTPDPSAAPGAADEEEQQPFPPAHWKRLDVADVEQWDCDPLQPIVEGMLAHGNFVFIAAQSQTGKTLLGLNLARKLLQGELLFEKYKITQVRRVLYLLLEDPERRAKDRILDTDHEFPQPLEQGRFIIQTASGFNLGDDQPQHFVWLESLIQGENYDVVFIDTYQKSTPGISSFDDEKQSRILHRLADLTRRLKVTLIVIDHFRKTSGTGSRTREITLDDVKGSGGKVQNADCIILMARTKDRTQITFQCYSKDFDDEIRILLDVSKRGSQEPKFRYAGDLERAASDKKAEGDRNRENVAAALSETWQRNSDIAKAAGLKPEATRKHLIKLSAEGRAELDGQGSGRRWRRPTASQR